MISTSTARILTLSVLLLTLFTNVSKAVFGTQAGLMVDLLFVVAVVLILQVEKIRYTKPVILLLAYIFLHAVGQLLIHGGLFTGNNYTDYRNMIRGGALFLLLLNTNFRSPDEVNSFFKPIFVIVASLMLLNLYAELIANKILSFDLRSLPYVQAAYGEVPTVYGVPGTGARVPTLLGAPHFFGLSLASLAFVFWHLYRHGYGCRHLIYLAAISMLFLSRLHLFVVFIVMFAYFARGLRLSWKSLFLFLGSVIALAVVLSEFGYAFVLTMNPQVNEAYDAFLHYGSPELLLDMVILPSLDEWYKIAFGVGAVTGNAQYGNILSLVEIEVGLIVELIPRYGVVLVFLYYVFLWRIFSGLRRIGYKVLSLALIPFMAAPLHMWMVNNTFTSDMFFVIAAYCQLVAFAFGRRSADAARKLFPGAPLGVQPV